MNWMIMPLNRYADFSGRSCRAEYWMFGLFQFLIAVIATSILFAAGAFSEYPNFGETSGFLIFFFIMVYLLIFFIPSLAVGIRRWHDLDQSGWMFLLFLCLGAIPYFGSLVNIGNIIWFCFRGTSGPNKYGEDPLGGHYY